MPNPQPNTAIQIRGGNCCLDLSSPKLGEIVVIYSIASESLSLFGNLSASAAKYVVQESKSIFQDCSKDPGLSWLVRHGDWRNDTDRLHAAVCSSINTEEVTRALNEDCGHHGHSMIDFSEQVPDGIVIGGAFAYFDGTTLFINGASGDFGRISKVALTICLKSQNIPYSLLEGLILQTANNATKLKPMEVQTGPAKRHDMQTIKAHKLLLKGKLKERKVYDLMTAFLLNSKF